jgi:transcriptional regulator GlxA family with amidase domain
MNRRDVLSLAATSSLAALAAPAGANELLSAADAMPPLRSTHNVPIIVAVVVGKQANVLDLAGPWEVFQDTMVDGWDQMPFQLMTISDSRSPIQATGGLQIVPTHAFDDPNLPQPNVIVMGAQGEHTPNKIAWIRRASENASVVMSVCTGAFLLAQTGLLDGLSATTHHEYFDQFARQFPSIALDRTARYVENPGGKLCCAGGITSGIELALRVVQRYFGNTAPAHTAYYMEYNRSSTRPAQSAG